jgi:hypothetical protein
VDEGAENLKLVGDRLFVQVIRGQGQGKELLQQLPHFQIGVRGHGLDRRSGRRNHSHRRCDRWGRRLARLLCFQ